MLLAEEYQPLIQYEKLGRDAMLSIPTPDHYLPLLYVIGTRQKGESSYISTGGGRWRIDFDAECPGRVDSAPLATEVVGFGITARGHSRWKSTTTG